MKMNNSAQEDANTIKVQIKEINSDTIECKHIKSGYIVKAFTRPDMKFDIGQIVLLQYRRNKNGGGYIVLDDLMEEIDANVLEAQHIINNGLMFTSLILENPETKQRMHSMVPSNEKLFSDTNIIIKGDKVRIRINNGNIFSVSTRNGAR